MLLAGLLSGLGYDVADFDPESGAKPDLFILDVPSAVSSIGRQILALKQTGEVFLPVLVVLGADDPFAPWLAEGFDDCLREPFCKKELQTKAALFLRLRGQSEELVRRSEALYHAIFEATGTATLMVDEDATIIMANKTTLVATGYSPEELIGTKWTSYASPESLDVMLKRHRMRRGDSGKAPERYETKLINKAREVRDVLLDIGMFFPSLRSGKNEAVEPELLSPSLRSGEEPGVRNRPLRGGSTASMPDKKRSVVSMTDVTERKRAEAAVLRAEQHYSALFDGAPVMYVLTRNEGGVPLIAECNRLFLSLLGYTREEAVGRPLADLYTHESRRALLEGGYQRALEGHFASEERQLVARDGRIVETLLQTMPEIDEQGKVVGTLAMFVDLTEMRAAQEEIKASEARYRALFENKHTVMLVIDPESGAIVDANPAAEHFYGWSREELTRRKIFDINTLSPEEIRTRLAQAGSRPRSEFIFQHRLSDGGTRDVEVFAGPIWIGSKKLLFSVINDISRRRQAEAKNKLLLQAVEQANDVVVVTDKDGTIQYVNPAFEKASGYAKDAAAGQNMRILKSGKQDEAFYRELWETISSGDIWRGRVVNKRRDGSLYTEEATISPVFDDAGAIVSYFAVKRDITEALRLEDEKRMLAEQLQHAQKMDAIGRLSGGVAHDFNNMLNVILGYGELVLEKLHQGDPLRQDVEQIVRAGKRSQELTRQLLAFSRKQPLQPEIIDINALLISLEKMLRRLIGADIDLKFSLSHDALRIKADPGQIEQVIINLAVNARDAMPHGGKLIIETVCAELDDLYAQNHVGAVAGEYVLIAVSDTGCGMDKETLSKAFEPFFTTKEKGKGTGLGLATTFGIIKQSGGNILIYSEPEQGTTFKIYLPAAHAEPELKTDFPTGTYRRDAGLQILVVEDEDLLRGLFDAILTSLGHHVAVAANGGEALLLVEEKGMTPDLVIADVVMPGMSGAVLSERLRRSRPKLKMLFMSGYTESAVAQRGVLDSATHFIQKPFTVEAIAQKIEQVMRATEGDS